MNELEALRAFVKEQEQVFEVMEVELVVLKRTLASLGDAFFKHLTITEKDYLVVKRVYEDVKKELEWQATVSNKVKPKS